LRTSITTTKFLIPALALIRFSGCNHHEQQAIQPVEAKPAEKAARQVPSAAEVFHLRTECASLAHRLFESKIREAKSPRNVQSPDSVIGDELSHYDVDTNRCYLRLTLNYLSPHDHTETILYDAQTYEELAYQIVLTTPEQMVSCTAPAVSRGARPTIVKVQRTI